MNIIYKPNGRAAEYSEYAINIGSGCIHGCKYCYAPLALRKKREDYHNECVIKKDLFTRVEKALIKLDKNNIKTPVLFCFTIDPYQNEAVAENTRQCLKLFNKHGQNFQILTKGGLRAAIDFDLYKSGDMFATTLTFNNDIDSARYEPGAAMPFERTYAIKKARDLGIRTWVSFEPALDEDQIKNLFEITKDYTDLYKIGKVSGYPSNIKDWRKFGLDIARLCKENGNEYLIKNDLKKHMV